MRIRADYLSGTTDAALADTDTTLSSPALADLPEIAAPNYAALVLSGGTNYEIVHVTAHTAAATTATITRGQEGSTAQAWASGADWLHGPTKYDVPQVGGTEDPDAPEGHLWFDESETPVIEAVSVTVDDASFLNVVGADVQTALADIDSQLGAASGGITVQDEDGNVGTGVTQIDFQGANVTAAAGTGEVVVTIAGGAGADAPLWARKAANTGRTSTTTLADDPDLTVALAANSSYRFEAMLMIYGPTGADFKFSFPEAAAGWSIVWGPIGPASNVAASDASAAWLAAWNEGTVTRIVGTAELSDPMVVHVIGSVVTDATAGALKLQWAQNASNAGAVTLYKGSHLMAQKVA